MKTSRILCAVAIIVVLSVNVQAAPKFYFFGSISAPLSDSIKYSPRWARAGMTEYFMPDSTLQGQFEYNFVKNSLVFAKIQKTLKFNDATLNLTAGQFLNPPQFLWPGAKALRTIDWPDMQAKFNSFSTGVLVEFKYFALTARFADYQSHSATLSLSGLSLLWEEHRGFGAVYSGEWHWLINPSGGAIKLTNGKRMYYLQNFINTEPIFGVKGLRAYGEVDFGDLAHKTFTGVSWELKPYCDLKVFYNTYTDGFAAEGTFSF